MIRLMLHVVGLSIPYTIVDHISLIAMLVLYIVHASQTNEVKGQHLPRALTLELV